METSHLKKSFFAGLAVFGLMACSEGGVEPIATPNGTSNLGASVALADAQSRMALCARTVVSSWQMSVDSSVLSQDIDSTFIERDFAVEADAFLDKESGYMTLASAGVDGDQDAWALRVENGKAIFAWRDASTNSEWFKLSAENVLMTNDTITVRAERYGELTVLYVDGIIVAAAESAGAIENMNGHFTIGFDPTSETENMHGRVLCVRFDKVRYIKKDFVEAAPDSVAMDTDAPLFFEPKAKPVPSEQLPDSSNQTSWLATWEFNDSSDAGRDFTGNGHDAKPGEGSVTIADSVANFDGTSGFTIPLKADLKVNSFVVEARVKPSKFSSMQNILVSEPPGRYGDGWMVRADDGYLTVHLRDEEASYTDWTVFTGKKLDLDQWNEIRVEHVNNLVKVFQNGELTVDASYNGNVSQLTYDWSIGYDAMNQSYHNRYFVGEMDYVRFGTLDKLSEGSLAKSSMELLADWEFNAPDFIGLDKIANNTTRIFKGQPKIVDEALTLDGESGLVIPLTKTFLRNEFAVATRLKPTSFGKIQNVFVAEPPGRFGDGWMVRVDDGILTVHFRDSQTDGVEWQVYSGKALELDQWTEIRVARTADGVKVYQDGELTIDVPAKGDVSQLEYDLSIGFDAMNQRFNDRYFNGQIDYVRYYGVRQ